MYLINTRKDGISPNEFATSARVQYVSDLKKQFTVPETAFETAIKNSRLLLIVHGFNNPFSYVVPEYLLSKVRISRAAPGTYDHIIGFTWPSGGSELDYSRAKGNTEEAGQKLREWLFRFTRLNCVIDIAGHSMAARVGYHALCVESALNLRCLFSFGAAIPREKLRDETVSHLFDNIEKLFAFHNRNDSTLKYWFRLVEWKEALGRVGPGRREHLIENVEKFHLIDCSNENLGHIDYLRSPRVVHVMAEILKGNLPDQLQHTF